ncbi:zinc finger CCHC-type and RNA-binding motif-containing protein 1 isoform X2 [Orussus abietinus]|nr:zinc finger CCHC-type and RNA-binding motif-containing protein 1 isoform X2 [Orussus abietinus]
MKDKVTRRSKGVAFVLFLKAEDAIKCAKELNNTEVGGRTVKSSIAADNGRSTEFIRRRDYPDKSLCYECGEEGHLSYKCSHNTLGPRNPPPKKIRKRSRSKQQYKMETNYFDSGSEEESKDRTHLLNTTNKDNEESDTVDLETLSAAIRQEQDKKELEKYRLTVASGQYDESMHQPTRQRRRFKKNCYFSDEEELSD